MRLSIYERKLIRNQCYCAINRLLYGVCVCSMFSNSNRQRCGLVWFFVCFRSLPASAYLRVHGCTRVICSPIYFIVLLRGMYTIFVFWPTRVFFFCTSLYSGLVFFTLYFLLWFGATTTDRRWCDCGSPKFMIAIYFQFLTFQFRCRNVRRFEIRIPHTHTTIELCLFIFNKIVALNIGNVFSTACTAWYSESGGKQRKRTNCIRLQNRLREEEQLIYFDSSSEYIRDIK